MRNKLYKFSFCLLLFWSSTLQAQKFEWAKQIGGSRENQSLSMKMDVAGNIYTTGCFKETVDFDPGVGTFNLTSSGGFDIFISKLDASGNFVWAKNIGSSSDDCGYSIALDATGNIYITGYFTNTMDSDPGTGIFNLTSVGNQDIFIIKLDTSGNFVWAKQMGSIFSDFSYSMIVDSMGNVYTTGRFAGTVDFDPGTGVFNLVSVGGTDIFVQKLDTSGNFVWAKNIGGINLDEGLSIVLDGTGNVYTTGRFAGTVDFDPGTGVFNLVSVGGSDVFIQKLDASGNFIWAKQMGGISDDYGYSLVVDGIGNIYTTGHFAGTADFDPGTGVFNLVSVGGSDVFVQKLDSSGSFVWAKSTGGTSDDEGKSIALDVMGAIYIGGNFKGLVDFDSGIGVFNLSSASALFSDIFIQKLDASGNFVWARRMGGTSGDAIVSLALDASGNIYTTGYFVDTADFDPGTGVFNLISMGMTDTFISKISPCPMITIFPSSLPKANGGIYNSILSQTGLSSGVTWSVIAGSLPAGLSLDASTGAISGTPSVTGSSSFTIQVTDGSCSRSQNYTLETVYDPILSLNNSFLNLIKIFPNPSSGMFQVQVKLNKQANVSISLYSLQESRSLVTYTGENQQEYLFNFSLREDIPAGIYALMVVSPNETRFFRVVIQK